MRCNVGRGCTAERLIDVTRDGGFPKPKRYPKRYQVWGRNRQSGSTDLPGRVTGSLGQFVARVSDRSHGIAEWTISVHVASIARSVKRAAKINGPRLPRQFEGAR